MKIISSKRIILKLINEKTPFIIETDTIIGISCLANDEKSKEEILKIKKRTGKKYITLISNIKQLDDLKISLSKKQKDIIIKSIIPTTYVISDFAFRLIRNKDLKYLIDKVGPIISTSVNISGDNYSNKISNIDIRIIKRMKYYFKLNIIGTSSPSKIFHLEKEVFLR